MKPSDTLRLLSPYMEPSSTWDPRWFRLQAGGPKKEQYLAETVPSAAGKGAVHVGFEMTLQAFSYLSQAFPPGSNTYVQRLHDTKGLKSLPVTVVSKEGFLMGSLELQ